MVNRAIFINPVWLWTVFWAKAVLLIIGIFASLPFVATLGGFSVWSGPWAHLGNPIWWTWAFALAIWWVSESQRHIRVVRALG